VLEKLTSTHYKNRVHEISDNNNRSLGAGGVCNEIATNEVKYEM